MKRYIPFFLLILSCLSNGYAQKSILRLNQSTLMHEVRETPSPADGEQLSVNPPRLMWPDKYPHLGAVLDGVDEQDFKPEVTYRVRLSRDPKFKKEVLTAERKWAFYNPFQKLDKGTWYWQHAYVTPEGQEEWSPIYRFYITGKERLFNPPSLTDVLNKLPTTHPRVLLDKTSWNTIIEGNKTNPEALAYIAKANKCLKRPLKHLAEEIDTTQVVKLTNIVQYRSALIRESRKIVDREEANLEAIVRAYLLTKDETYYREGIKRLIEILSWKNSKYFAGDFNRSTILSMSTSAYDAWYDLLTPGEKKILLRCIRDNGKKFFHEYVNHLENRIADNHVWQMTFRILNMAAFATYGELPEASTWVDYCYNEWVSRLPGLNTDGAWHNGDSYFQVNIRTLIEVPEFYSRISGFNFFADPWYNNNALYVIYHQPPFSKSAGHGNSHESKKQPNGVRVGYADALARECGNVWAAAYVNAIMERDPDILKSGFLGKSGDLTWYRCITTKVYPKDQHQLNELPMAKIFNETGVATMHSQLGDVESNAMLSFRSSPYGSTSHALANQNAFNTFYGGKEIFYSSGHRTGFTDDHCMYAYRNSRAHNTILVDGMTQIIGTEGYGWMPRWYEGEQLSYMVGDASNAYGKITSALWLKRGELSDTRYTPEKGWDENKLNRYRRHIVQLGRTGLFVIYDELEGKIPVTWSYLLHTTELPMTVNTKGDETTVIGQNKAGGQSIAHLYASEKVETSVIDTFFCTPSNWKNVTNAKGETVKYPNHWHFSAKTQKCLTARFLTIIDTHGNNRESMPIIRHGDTFTVGSWVIRCNLKTIGRAAFEISNPAEKVTLRYDENRDNGKTIITDRVKGKKVKRALSDYLPPFEI